MNTRIFREVSLARLASPEQLDHILRVTAPKDWIGLIAVFGLLAMTVLWGYEGSIPTTAKGQGVIVRTGGILNVVSRGSGLILNMQVKVGDRIKANQVVGRIAQPVLMERMKALREQLSELRLQRERATRRREDSTRLQLDALDRQRSNNDRRVAALDSETKLAAEQIPVEEQLFSRGLITRQQVIAAKQKLVTLQNDIDSLRAQNTHLEAEAFSLRSQPMQEDETMQAQIANVERELAAMSKEFTLSEEVMSPYDGEVVELKTYTGATVAVGEPILSIQPEAKDLELLAYLPSSQAKDAASGMEVQVSPTIVKREEYGFLRGKVVYVFNYPATTAAMMRHFENESLVRSLTASGPVTELRIQLERDPATPSGFHWSTPKGAPIVLTGGTICDVRIVTRRQKPMSLVLPYLKQKTGLM
jgi:HlyD family secretion protein